GWGDVAPHRGGRAAPTAGAENLSRAVDILESSLDEGHAVPGEIVVAVHFANEFRDRVRAVMVEGDGRIFLGGTRPLKRLLRHGTARGRINHLLQGLDVL